MATVVGSAVRRAVMRAIRVSEYGGTDKCKLVTDAEIPTPGSKQVLIKLGAAGVNPVETYIITGTHAIKPPLPFTPGGDGAGVIEKVGPEVTKFKEGERVFCMRSITGTYAQYTVANEDDTHPLGDRLSFQQGAALGTPYFTAVRALMQKSRAKPGDTVLIHGASGAVGLACCQIGRSQGMVVIGTAGTEEGLKLIKDHGATHAFNHREAGYQQQIQAAANNGGGPDVIIEMLANVNLESDLQMVGKNGRIVIVGSRGTVEVTPRLAMGKESEILGMALFAAPKEAFPEMASFIQGGLQAGWVNPVVGSSYPLEKTQDALTEVIAHTGGSKGKIVLNIVDPKNFHELELV